MLQLFKSKGGDGRNFLVDETTGQAFEVEPAAGVITAGQSLIKEMAEFSAPGRVTKNRTTEKPVIKPKKEAKFSDKPKVRKTEQKWSRKFDYCQGCGTTEKKHAGNGLCITCRDKAKSGKLDTKATPRAKYECLDCWHEFNGPADFEDAKAVGCKKCESKNLVQK